MPRRGTSGRMVMTDTEFLELVGREHRPFTNPFRCPDCQPQDVNVRRSHRNRNRIECGICGRHLLTQVTKPKGPLW